ncbi:N-acetyl-alpha-D-glucosaminyl L-malate deacetylase 1 [Pandoraea sputorum]|uniref:N-acetyl-alpha-D-glucosaminyl L-malate deacetylase 1 n=1 Tax=Pandoraea sputorum TaxID=93222 RepID=A0A5E5BEQ0_9BURK|nr:N-acetyl-alpha-D-glucosaminyl L-malate deacetylase 1 [Pandoraea sputorum]
MAALSARLIAGEGTAEATWQRWFHAHALPQITARERLARSARVHVVAPHPDDEILGGEAPCDSAHGPACRSISGPSRTVTPVIQVRHSGHPPG